MPLQHIHISHGIRGRRRNITLINGGSDEISGVPRMRLNEDCEADNKGSSHTMLKNGVEKTMRQSVDRGDDSTKLEKTMRPSVDRGDDSTKQTTELAIQVAEVSAMVFLLWCRQHARTYNI